MNYMLLFRGMTIVSIEQDLSRLIFDLILQTGAIKLPMK